MRKTIRAIILSVLVCSIGAAGLLGQVKYGGNLSFEYLKGQAASDFPAGSLQNIRAGLLATGVVGTKFGFTLEARSWSESLFQVEQAWVGFLPSKTFNIKAGLYLVPFGLWNQASRPYEALLIGTPLNLEFLYPQSWRDLGVLVDGQFGVVTYAVYIGNGLREAQNLTGGQQFADNNKDKAKGGRVGLVLGQGVQAGVSYYAGKYDDFNERGLTLKGADFQWVTPQWEVRAEATKGIVKNPGSVGDGRSEGYSVWMVMSFAHLQPVGSFQKVKYQDPYHGDGLGVDIERSRWTAGFRYVLGPNLFIKAEYEWNRETLKIRDNLVRIQAAFGF
jgi:hypothetical protein